jgi:hypothetical protein
VFQLVFQSIADEMGLNFLGVLQTYGTPLYLIDNPEYVSRRVKSDRATPETQHKRTLAHYNNTSLSFG